MKLKSFNYFICLILIIFLNSPILSEEKIDIWKNKKESTGDNSKKESTDKQKKSNIESYQNIKAPDEIQIKEGSEIQEDDRKIYGIYEPANYNLSLNMWSATKAEDLRSSLKRINKINLSRSSNEILESILFSFSYPP